MGNNIYTLVVSYRTYTQHNAPAPFQPPFHTRRQGYTLPANVVENCNRTTKTYNFVQTPIRSIKPELEPILEKDEIVTNIFVDSNE